MSPKLDNQLLNCCFRKGRLLKVASVQVSNLQWWLIASVMCDKGDGLILGERQACSGGLDLILLLLL